MPLAGFVLVGGIVAEIINAVIGEVILLAVIGFFKKGLRPTSEPKPQLNATIHGATSLRPCRFPGDVSRLTICVEGLLNLRQASPSLAFAAPRPTKMGDRASAVEQVLEPRMDYTKLALPDLANAIIQTERAIRRCKEILDDLRQPKTMGLQAVVEATRGLLPMLEEDLKTLEKAYTSKRK